MGWRFRQYKLARYRVVGAVRWAVSILSFLGRTAFVHFFPFSFRAFLSVFHTFFSLLFISHSLFIPYSPSFSHFLCFSWVWACAFLPSIGGCSALSAISFFRKEKNRAHLFYVLSHAGALIVCSLVWGCPRSQLTSIVFYFPYFYIFHAWERENYGVSICLLLLFGVWVYISSYLVCLVRGFLWGFLLIYTYSTCSFFAVLLWRYLCIGLDSVLCCHIGFLFSLFFCVFFFFCDHIS